MGTEVWPEGVCGGGQATPLTPPQALGEVSLRVPGFPFYFRPSISDPACLPYVWMEAAFTAALPLPQA